MDELRGGQMISDVQIKLSALWIALMLTYLLGDVLRIYSGDFKLGDPNGFHFTQPMLMSIAMLMLIPIVIIAAVVLLLFNLVGLPTYPSAYDKFLIFVGLVFNAVTIWYAWKWV
jgi:hypothetical protein